MQEAYIILMVLGSIFVLLTGFPVAFCLGGVALFVALVGQMSGHFDTAFWVAFPGRLYGIMGNETLLAVPLFIFMSILLERSGVSEELLEKVAFLFRGVKGGLGVAVCLVGALLAASTGIVGATVVTMGLISLPAMLKNRYKPSFASGIVAASGTLGQIIPPSIILIILGDQISSAYQQSLLARGDYSGGSVAVGDLFAGALMPGFLLVSLYVLYILIRSHGKDNPAPSAKSEIEQDIPSMDLILDTLGILIPPLILIIGVLGSILIGAATPTEAASVGAVGSLSLTVLRKKLNRKMLQNAVYDSTKITSMIFMILIGANIFSLVFRAYGGDDMIGSLLRSLPGEKWSAFFAVMLLIFFLGFFLDFFEITLVVIPIVGPILLGMGMDPIWLGVIIAMNLQTSFLTPPFGFALFYLRGVAPKSISTTRNLLGGYSVYCNTASCASYPCFIS